MINRQPSFTDSDSITRQQKPFRTAANETAAVLQRNQIKHVPARSGPAYWAPEIRLLFSNQPLRKQAARFS
jgi:hypothetical protein